MLTTIAPQNEFQRQALAEKAAREKKKPKKVRVQPAIKAARLRCSTYSPQELMLRTLLRGLQDRAAKKGLDFNLTTEWLMGKLQTTHCEATGIRFEGARNEPFGLTFDRRDNGKGYTIENVWVTCWIYNRCKLNGTHADVMRLARALVGSNSPE